MHNRRIKDLGCIRRFAVKTMNKRTYRISQDFAIQTLYRPSNDMYETTNIFLPVYAHSNCREMSAP
jgi:hypothetical protein